MNRSPRLGSLTWNRETFGDPSTWSRNGDIWTHHADACGQPYETWKHSVVEYLLDPYLAPDLDVLEIGSGHGRWSEFMVDRCRSVALVDLNESCTEVCRRRFGKNPTVSCLTNDGRSLPVASASIDVVWSFGTFVHIIEDDVDAYLADVRRALRPGGRFLIHHTGWSDWGYRSFPLFRHLGKPGRVLHRRLVEGLWRPSPGRAPMSAEHFASLATGHGLRVDRRFRTWGDRHQFGLTWRDIISPGVRP